MRETCENCRHRHELVKWDYKPNGAVYHSRPEGFICMACANEGKALWMVGLEPMEDYCEDFTPRVDRLGDPLPGKETAT